MKLKCAKRTFKSQKVSHNKPGSVQVGTMLKKRDGAQELFPKFKTLSPEKKSHRDTFGLNTLPTRRGIYLTP